MDIKAVDIVQCYRILCGTWSYHILYEWLTVLSSIQCANAIYLLLLLHRAPEQSAADDEFGSRGSHADV